MLFFRGGFLEGEMRQKARHKSDEHKTGTQSAFLRVVV